VGEADPTFSKQVEPISEIPRAALDADSCFTWKSRLALSRFLHADSQQQ